MATNYFPSRGCVYKIDGGGSSKAFISLNPALTGSAQSPIILESSSITQKDLVVPKPTLGKNKVLYSFGEDFGEVRIGGAILLGEVGKSAAGFSPVTGYFQSNRTSTKKSPISVSVGQKAFQFYLTALVVGELDSQYNIQRFVLSGVQV